MSANGSISGDSSQGSESWLIGDEDEYTTSSGSSNSSCWSETDEDASPGAASPNMEASPPKSTDRFLSLEMVKMLRISSSAGSLNPMAGLASAFSPQKRRCSEGKQLSTSSKMVFAIQSKNPLDSPGQSKTTASQVPKPKDKLLEILREQGHVFDLMSHKLLGDFFVKGSVEAYSFELMNSVRQNDLDSVRRFHSEGRQMQCCNKFGEGIVHAVARRGSAEMLQFLMEEAGVSVRVTCDGGRTPVSQEFYLQHCSQPLFCHSFTMHAGQSVPILIAFDFCLKIAQTSSW